MRLKSPGFVRFIRANCMTDHSSFVMPGLVPGISLRDALPS
jgi:hypothetical protein